MWPEDTHLKHECPVVKSIMILGISLHVRCIPVKEDEDSSDKFSDSSAGTSLIVCTLSHTAERVVFSVFLECHIEISRTIRPEVAPKVPLESSRLGGCKR